MSQQINLYDPALETQRDWLALSNVVLAGALLVLVVGVFGVLARQNVPLLTAQTAANETQLQALREQMTALGRQISDRKPNPRIEQELGAARILLAARGEVLETLRRRLGPDSESFAAYLNGFARQSLAGLWLTGFSYDATHGGMEIHGRTVNPALLPEYIGRLNREPAFRGRAFSALKLVAGKPDPVPGAPAQPVAAPIAAVTQKAPFHEFVLTPSVAPSLSKSAVLTQAPGTGGAS